MESALARALRALWSPFRAYTDHTLVRDLSMSSVALVEAAEQGLQEQVVGMFDLIMPELEIDDIPAVMDDFVHPRPVNPYREYDRPAEQARYAMSKGATPAEAAEKAVKKAVQLANDDLMLTRRKAPMKIIQGSEKVIGYRRVIMPELSESGTCGLCLAASTRLYSKSELLPIHTNCKCEILPVTKTQDPARLFNEEDLQRLYEIVGGNSAADLLTVRYKVGEHGELGPVLERVHKERLGQSPTRDEKKPEAAPDEPDWSDPIENLEGRIESVARQIMRLERKKSKGQTVDNELKSAHDELRRLQRRKR